MGFWRSPVQVILPLITLNPHCPHGISSSGATPAWAAGHGPSPPCSGVGNALQMCWRCVYVFVSTALAHQICMLQSRRGTGLCRVVHLLFSGCPCSFLNARVIHRISLHSHNNKIIWLERISRGYLVQPPAQRQRGFFQSNTCSF